MDIPAHDWASHGNDGFEQFARGFNPDNIEHTIAAANDYNEEEYDNSYAG